VLGGLPALRNGVPPALAKELPMLIGDASKDIDLPYELRLAVIDHTSNTSARATRTTISVWGPETIRVRGSAGTLTVDRGSWELVRAGTRAIRGREPFDGDVSMPTDILVPAQTLAGNERAEIVGRAEVIGHRTIGVRMPARDATGLFDYLRDVEGDRPRFFPRDDVTVWLDDDDFVPLRYEVRASHAPERRLWSSRLGIGVSEGGALLFSAVAERLDSARTARPTIDPTATEDRGFTDLDDGALEQRLGFAPLRPRTLYGLTEHRAGIAASRPGEAITTYAKGLAWLKVRETRSWSQQSLFGNVSSLAARRQTPIGPVYVEPAATNAGRRVAIHGQDVDLQLESNLSATELLAIAASFGIEARPAPDDWTTTRWSGGITRRQLSAAEVRDRIEPYIELPDPALLEGYELATAHLVETPTSHGVTLFYARQGVEPDGIGLRLHLQPGGAFPPPLEPDTIALSVAGVGGRYSADRAELEWVASGVYRSITTHGFDLAQTIAIAESLEPR
ncbi:MAG: hypothetical protein WD826_04620, partial [Actinomycetota bacterium]